MTEITPEFVTTLFNKIGADWNDLGTMLLCPDNREVIAYTPVVFTAYLEQCRVNAKLEEKLENMHALAEVYCNDRELYGRECHRLTEALQFYASIQNYLRNPHTSDIAIESDVGKKAREALEAGKL